MSFEQYIWSMVDVFVYRFNEEHERMLSSPELVHFDKMSRWYGLGGHWINVGMPQLFLLTVSRKMNVRDRTPSVGLEGLCTG